MDNSTDLGPAASAERVGADAPRITSDLVEAAGITDGLTSAEQLSVVAEAMSQEHLALYVWELVDLDDPAGMRVIYANEACAEMFGVSVEQLTHRSLREIFPRVQSNDRLVEYKEVALGGPARDMGDVTVPGGSRGYMTFSVRVFPVSHRRMGVVYRDITERRAVEAAAVEALDAMSDALFVFDKDWRYTFVNTEAERLTGMSREAVMATRLWDRYPDLLGTMLHENLERAARDRVTSSGEQYFPELSMWISMRAHPTRDGVALFVQDVTVQKKFEERVKQSQKMDAVAALAGGIAHDFNNALTVIRTAAELALEDVSDDQVRKDVEQIQSTAEHASVLTSQLLTIARMRPTQGGPTDVHELVERLLGILRALVGDSITVTAKLDADLTWIDVSPDQLEQIMFNLILNARDAATGTGVITVSTKNVTVPDDVPASSGAMRPACYLQLEVHDDGGGMNSETAQRAFDPFFTTKPAGTGLGLPSVYGIVTQSGGTMDLVSRSGVGTTVTILLEAHAQEAPTSGVATAPPRVASGRRTIMVVEDDDEVRVLVSRALTRLGYTTIEASGGAEALALFQQGSPQIDLLVTDVSMPHMSGAELVAQLHATQPELPVVYMSGYTANDVARSADETSSARFVQKPFHIAVLAEAVESALTS